MRAAPALALLAATAALAGCADIVPLSALAGAERRDQTVIVAHSTGGGVFATAADLGRIWKAGGTVIISGDCMSACTLALMDVVASSVCWTDEATFLFHAAHINGRLHPGQTELNFAALPAAIQALLPPPGSWRVDRWHAVSGREAHDALRRGRCTQGDA